MRQEKAVSPIIATLLLVAITVSLASLYAVIGTGLISVEPTESYDIPEVDSVQDGDKLTVELLDLGDAESVKIKSPSTSTNSDTTISKVGDSVTLDVKPKDQETYKIISVDKTGQETFVRSVRYKSVPDQPSDRNSGLSFIEGTVEGGPESFGFDLINNGDETFTIDRFKVSEVQIEDLRIDTDTRPPSKKGGNGNNGNGNNGNGNNGNGNNGNDASSGAGDELQIESTPTYGWCGKPKPKQLPLNEITKFSECQASSEPSLADPGTTMGVTFNGVTANKDTDYMALSPDPALTDVVVTLYAPNQSVDIPVLFDTLVLPEDDSKTYSNQIQSSMFSSGDPGRIIIKRDVTLTSSIGDVESEIYLLEGVTAQDELDGPRSIVTHDNVDIQDDIDNIEDSVEIDDESKVSSVKNAGSVNIGSDSLIRGQIGSIDEYVEIGARTVAKDEIDGAKSIRTGSEFIAEDDIGNIDGRASFGSESDLSKIGNVGSLYIGPDSAVSKSIDGVSKNTEIGARSAVDGSIKNIGGDLYIEENVKASGQIQNIDGDLYLRDNVEVTGTIQNVGGSIICGRNVTTSSGAC